jgi:hypothetical protein
MNEPIRLDLRLEFCLPQLPKSSASGWEQEPLDDLRDHRGDKQEQLAVGLSEFMKNEGIELD